MEPHLPGLLSAAKSRLGFGEVSVTFVGLCPNLRFRAGGSRVRELLGQGISWLTFGAATIPTGPKPGGRTARSSSPTFQNQPSLPSIQGLPWVCCPGKPLTPLLCIVPHPGMIGLTVCEPDEDRPKPESSLPWCGPGLALPFWLRTAQQIRLGAIDPMGRVTLPGSREDIDSLQDDIPESGKGYDNHKPEEQPSPTS